MVSRVGDHLRLVQRHPVPYAVAKPPSDEVRVRREVIDDRARGPATLLLQRLREIPVVQGDEREPGRKTGGERWDLAHRGGSASSHARPMRALMPPST